MHGQLPPPASAEPIITGNGLWEIQLPIGRELEITCVGSSDRAGVSGSAAQVRNRATASTPALDMPGGYRTVAGDLVDARRLLQQHADDYAAVSQLQLPLSLLADWQPPPLPWQVATQALIPEATTAGGNYGAGADGPTLFMADSMYAHIKRTLATVMTAAFAADDPTNGVTPPTDTPTSDQRVADALRNAHKILRASMPALTWRDVPGDPLLTSRRALKAGEYGFGTDRTVGWGSGLITTLLVEDALPKRTGTTLGGGGYVLIPSILLTPLLTPADIGAGGATWLDLPHAAAGYGGQVPASAILAASAAVKPLLIQALPDNGDPAAKVATTYAGVLPTRMWESLNPMVGLETAAGKNLGVTIRDDSCRVVASYRINTDQTSAGEPDVTRASGRIVASWPFETSRPQLMDSLKHVPTLTVTVGGSDKSVLARGRLEKTSNTCTFDLPDPDPKKPVSLRFEVEGRPEFTRTESVGVHETSPKVIGIDGKEVDPLTEPDKVPPPEHRCCRQLPNPGNTKVLFQLVAYPLGFVVFTVDVWNLATEEWINVVKNTPLNFVEFDPPVFGPTKIRVIETDIRTGKETVVEREVSF